MPTETPTKPVETAVKPDKIGLIYYPEKESHIGTASVGSVDPVRMLEIPIKVGSAPQLIGVNGGTQQFVDIPLFKTLRLMVGSQIVDAADWDAAKQDPLVKQRIYWRAIVEMVPTKATGIGGLSVFDEEDAIQFIASCYDEERMKGWLLDESRPGVRSQITERLKDLRGDRPE
jgi:hypothetical protein